MDQQKRRSTESSLIFSLQALLIRHETYIADSERERKAMVKRIDSLEEDKRALEETNSAAIKENSKLLDQLEAVNNAVILSDAKVSSLQATLKDTREEVAKLTQLAVRAERLELQLQDYEAEQAQWRSNLAASEEAEKAAVRRWRQAERMLGNMQDQIERVEREAKEESEAQAEAVRRAERKKAVETRVKSSGRTVSPLIRDILQDNTNLQVSVMELRNMLRSSHEEMESLRRQLQIRPPSPEPVSLKTEIKRAACQELHVHHHYHRGNQRSLRRKKKRPGGTAVQPVEPCVSTSTETSPSTLHPSLFDGEENSHQSRPTTPGSEAEAEKKGGNYTPVQLVLGATKATVSDACAFAKPSISKPGGISGVELLSSLPAKPLPAPQRDKTPAKKRNKSTTRPSGVNQSGPLPVLLPMPAPICAPMLQNLNTEELQRALIDDV
ncbi:hypothetical protein K470DRAFT_258957 [Piedraia hortae CBS 480.64]|uniref:Uncharacterized protein n=1 Tax=Piedraia hortae CBS 480.64 TaxID=1314780 RepID=A0A6A7BVV0_9PEZI|nr:hypothetical protein K470DRAFT_258957 [Piedraia hortae CBS 480.64]